MLNAATDQVRAVPRFARTAAAILRRGACRSRASVSGTRPTKYASPRCCGVAASGASSGLRRNLVQPARPPPATITRVPQQVLAPAGRHRACRSRPVGAPLDTTLPEMGVRLTDLVKTRASSSDALLKGSDTTAGVSSRIEAAAPKVVAFNGGKAADQVARYLGHGRTADGPADWRWQRVGRPLTVELGGCRYRDRDEDGGMA